MGVQPVGGVIDMSHFRVLHVQAVGVVLLFLAGCGGGRGSVSGTVTLKGQPLDQGRIQFFLVGGPAGPSGGAMIRHGKYELRGDHGLDPGSYTVQISSAGPSKDAGEITMGEFPVTHERIPAEYNTKSTLSVAVTARGPNAFDFTID